MFIFEFRSTNQWFGYGFITINFNARDHCLIVDVNRHTTISGSLICWPKKNFWCYLNLIIKQVFISSSIYVCSLLNLGLLTSDPDMVVWQLISTGDHSLIVDVNCNTIMSRPLICWPKKNLRCYSNFILKLFPIKLMSSSISL